MLIFFGLCYSASELFNIKPKILGNDYRSLTNQKVTISINPHFYVTNINFSLKDQNGRFFRVEIYEGNYLKRLKSTDFYYQNFSRKCIFKMMSNFSDSDIITLNITYDDNRPTMFYNFKCIKTKPLFYSLFTCIFTICSVLTKILFIYIDRNHNLSSNREIQNFRVLKSFFIDRTVAQRVITMFLYLQIYNFCNNLEVTLDPTLFVIIVAVIVVFDYVEHTYISFIILSFCFIQFTQKSEIISQQTNEIQYLSCCDVKIEGGFDLDPGIPGKLIDLKNTIYSPVNIGKCRLCKYNYTAESHSTSRDLAIFISMGESQAIVPRIRSLRTAGCKAKILLFTDSKKSFPARFDNCGIDIVTLKLSKRINKDQIIMMRYIIISDILKKYGSAFDRVLYCDGFDTFFPI